MKVNAKYVQQLMFNRGWSQTEFANELGVCRAEVNRYFNGKRKGGAKFIGALIRIFPDEPLDKLFFLDHALPVGNAKEIQTLAGSGESTDGE